MNFKIPIDITFDLDFLHAGMRMTEALGQPRFLQCHAILESFGCRLEDTFQEGTAGRGHHENRFSILEDPLGRGQSPRQFVFAQENRPVDDDSVYEDAAAVAF